METQKNPFDDFEVIHTYTSKEAADDGVLVEVGQYGPSGINYMSRSIWESFIKRFDNKYGTDAPWLVLNLKCAVLKEIVRKGERVERSPRLVLLDWYYKVELQNFYGEDWVFLLCRNETGGYTVMFPEDY